MFPWGEATLTLEDVMILGGFSPIGDQVTRPVTENLIWLVEEMNKVRTRLCKSSSKVAGHRPWLEHFMERERDSKIEHVGFLSLWLSRFVFCLSTSITKEVFPIAALLSSGVKVSLGRAVLAGIYQNLRMLKDRAMASSDMISGSGPLRLVQLWGFERFPHLGPKQPNLLKPGEPRVARWHKLSFKIDLKLVKTVLSSVTNFLWRPYAENLENWRQPLYCRENEQFLASRWNLDGDLKSYLQFLQPCELVGVGCREQYRPQRVAMQFGLDQDLPGDSAAWCFGSENMVFFTPPRSVQPGVSSRYLKWWRGSMSTGKSAIKNSLLLNKANQGSSLLVEVGRKGNESKSHSRSPFCNSKIASSRLPAEHDLMGKCISQDKTFGASSGRSRKASVSRAPEKHNSNWDERNLSTAAELYPYYAKNMASEGRNEFSASAKPPLNRAASSKSQSRDSTALSRPVRSEGKLEVNNMRKTGEQFHEHKPIRQTHPDRNVLGSHSTMRAASESLKTGIVRERGHEFSSFPRNSHQVRDEKYGLNSNGLQDSRRPDAFSVHTASSGNDQHIYSFYPAYSPTRAAKPVYCNARNGDCEDSMFRIEQLKRYQSTGKGTTNRKDMPQCSLSSRDCAGSGKKPNLSHRSANVPKQEKRKARDPDEKQKGNLTDPMSDEGESEPKREIRVDLSRKGVRSVSLTIHLDDIEEKVTTPNKTRRLG